MTRNAEENPIPICPFCEKEIDYIPKIIARDGTTVYLCQHCRKILSVGFTLENIC